MLELKGITKDYQTGDTTVHALKGISVTFRDQEFVSILGQSGCGKTTLLNIIGGLDHYTQGDLVINGRSTKSYLDRDWDTYRNHSVGFVFQSYNLIAHQSVVANVEMALLLSGVSKNERRRRAEEALRRVGLGEHLTKRPSQLSGGQMQRVAIARAIVNDPEIILADEPTGALDTETSVEVMEILKELSRDRLVVMVTHNPQLAEQYSDRIVRIQDGMLTDDTSPCQDAALTQEEIQRHAVADVKKGRRSMSYASAVALSFTNLMTKKGRTLLTVFAGSIGIIGIALILSLSGGTQAYINQTEQSTMGSYPLSIQKTAVDMSAMITSMMGGASDHEGPSPRGTVESKNIVTDMVTSVADGAQENDMRAIKAWLDGNPQDIQKYVTDIQYKYDTPLNVYASDTSNGAVQVNPATVLNALGISTSGEMQTEMMSSMSAMGSGYDVWNELLDNQAALKRDWDVLAGHMPRAWNEAVIALDEDGRISDYTLYALGLLDQEKLSGMMHSVMSGKNVEAVKGGRYTYDELMALSFKVLPETAKYERASDGTWQDKSGDPGYLKRVVDEAQSVKIVGVVKPSEENTSASNWGEVLYRSDLIEHLLSEVDASEVVAAQRNAPTTDVFTGLPFAEDATRDMTYEEVEAMMAMLPSAQAEAMRSFIDEMRASGMSDEQIGAAVSKQVAAQTDHATYEGNMAKLGVADREEPSLIQIYPVDFDAKEYIDGLIDEYNDNIRATGEGSEIRYTDIVGTMMASVTDIVGAISYILIAFVAISLVVSSIMIGIITYISVLERTKEIGILRAIGASKRDVSRVFTAETIIIGATSGVFAIAFTLVALIPINMVIEQVAGVSGLAQLPVAASAVLVCISMGLTLLAGFAPSRMAAKKDPVSALRAE